MYTQVNNGLLLSKIRIGCPKDGWTSLWLKHCLCLCVYSHKTCYLGILDIQFLVFHLLYSRNGDCDILIFMKYEFWNIQVAIATQYRNMY